MRLEYQTLKDKIMGCWNGKNIGGCLGAPFEGFRQINTVEFYTPEVLADPPANDDLDLQILWLNAVERFGKYVDSDIFSEYWLSYVIPNWVEYGSAKANMRRGLKAPLSGVIENDYCNSNGCFIRSEIWACLCPGVPDLAARYAYLDGVIDHSGEGVYAEIFCATVESAAFVEADKFKLIEIGLSYIPEDSDCTRAVRMVLDCYEKKMDWKDVRIRLLKEIGCNFGIQDKIPAKRNNEFPPVKAGYDAPCHIGLTVLSWLYGEDDFEKTICLAVNVGDDADCTSATVGSIMGIILGDQSLPEKWKSPLNDKIITKCLDLMSGGVTAPATVGEMTERVLNCIPVFLEKRCKKQEDTGFYTVDTRDVDALAQRNSAHLPMIDTNTMEQLLPIETLLSYSPHAVIYREPTFNAVLDYCGENIISLGESKRMTLTVTDNGVLCEQRWLSVSVFTRTDGVRVTKGANAAHALQITHDYKAFFEIELTAEELIGDKTEFYIDIQMVGRPTSLVIKGMLLHK